jgi:hypothetical protein
MRSFFYTFHEKRPRPGRHEYTVYTLNLYEIVDNRVKFLATQADQFTGEQQLLTEVMTRVVHIGPGEKCIVQRLEGPHV